MMERPLVLHQYSLAPAAEWQPAPGAWWFLGVTAGDGYVFHGPLVEVLSPESLLVSPPSVTATLRASQVASLSVSGFRVDPEQLGGVVTLAERSWLDEAARRLGGPVVRPADDSRAVQFRSLLADAAAASALSLRFRLLGFAAAFWESCLPVPSLGDPAASDAAARFAALVDGLTPGELVDRSSAELAAACGCCERHLTRLFRQRFGRSPRELQVEHRLLKARELLRDSSTKIIDVALESGFRHLSLFNAMFKRRFGTTPSGWREQKAARKAARRRSSGRSLIAVLLALGLGASLSAAVAAPTPAAPAPVAPAPAAPATSTNGPTFEVKGFQVEGNTLLKPEIIDESLAPYITNHASFDTLRAALTALQLTYRARGWVTVSVGLPPQQLTNGLVKVAVTEGRLTEIQVVGNRHFSSNNIMSALPSLSTNVYLNSAWFQPELDNANANRDRQIYPVISPGPDPGTTALTLKVKDRLPLHGRLEMDNYGPYGTPPDRIDATVQYNNLWQADHQIGVQYNFSPSQTKVENQMPRFWNQPADVAYSAFYRFPVGPQRALLAVPEFNVNDFGYDPATRRFKAPPATGRPEIIVFASRSDNDSGIKLGPVIPVSESPLVTVASQASGQDLTVNAGAGGRFSYPLPVLGPLRSVASFGPDWKHYSLNSYNTNTFFFRIIQTNDNEPVIIERTKAFPQDALIRNLDYLPLTLGWNGQISDPFGSTSFNLSESANAADLNTETFLGTNNLANAPGAGNYFITRMQASRDQRIHGDWGITLRADGQWANQAIINNEQFGLGGSAGVRGYRENEEYGDSGWRGSFEPHTPYFELGRGANTQVLRVRFVAFMDYGQRFLKEATVRDEKLAQWGVGFGGKVTLGEFFEVNVQLGWALLDTPVTQAGTMRTYFSVAGQF